MLLFLPGQKNSPILRGLTDWPKCHRPRYQPFFVPLQFPSDTRADVVDHGGSNSFTSHYVGVAGPSGTSTYIDNGITYSYTYSALDDGAGNVHGQISLDGIFAPDENGFYSTKNAISSVNVRDGSSTTILFGEVSRSNVATGIRHGWAFGVSYDNYGNFFTVSADLLRGKDR